MGNKESNERLEQAARALRAGEIDRGEFLRATRDKWRAVSGTLFARWRRRLPAWVERADIEQELQILALEAVGNWKEGGASIGAFVTWCAIHRTQRQMNRWRGARLHGNEGKNPGWFESPFSSAFAGAESDPAAAIPAPSEDPTDRLDAGEKFDAVLLDCATVREAIVLLALRECDGSTARAAGIIWEDFRARVECELSDERHAARVVDATLARLAERFGERAA